MSVEERELVLRAQQGDVLAMSRLLDRLAPWIARLCGSIALDAGDDAAQEALVQIFRDLRTLREPSALRAWARRVAAREAVRHARRERERARFESGGTGRTQDDTQLRSEGVEAMRVHAARDRSRATESAGGGPDPGVAHDVRSVLARLSPEQRAILVLRDLEGLSEDEAAAQLSVARGTVKSRLFRAREAFLKRWSE